MAAPTPEFERACAELGWGDAEEGLWFVGIEEGSDWKGKTAADVREYFKAKQFFRPIPADAPSYPGREGRKIREITAKITSCIRDGDFARWREQQERIWKPDSKIAQANLYPLGRSHTSVWPADNERLFGFGQRDLAEYRRCVIERRCLRFRAAKKELKPKAIVCFGKTYWCDFVATLETPFTREIVPGKVLANDAARILFVPFFAYWYVPDALAKRIANELTNWGVRIP